MSNKKYHLHDYKSYSKILINLTFLPLQTLLPLEDKKRDGDGKKDEVLNPKIWHIDLEESMRIK
ncbi:hypothetical protein [Candidatus Tisiphia endosymbiont of Myopa tessellatipennis]|uniref:hypothetical protein n=1 Tax=Candidatus Tisiphia endosymbiont of Myopa tessellatipennis TaxID=3066257 RepID=UPI00313C5646